MEPKIIHAPDVGIGRLMQPVYNWMAFGLGLTALIAYIVASSQVLMAIIFSNVWIFFGLILVELGVVMYLSYALNRMSQGQAQFYFILYAVLNGLTLSVVFLAYELGSIGTVFLTTAAMFGVMSVIGATTKRDLTTMGSLAIMALIGLIIATIVNMFIGNAQFDLILSYIGVIIFVALTAYDTQKIKDMVMSNNLTESELGKVAILGALTLYLDFINLFLKLLHIMGRRRD